MNHRQTQPQTQTRPTYPAQRYAVIVASGRYWGVDRECGYCHGPEALEAVARLRRDGPLAYLAISDTQGIPEGELRRLGLPGGRPRQTHRGRVWF